MYSLKWLLESQRYIPCLVEELWKFLPAEWGTSPFAFGHAHLNEHLPKRWICRCGQADSLLMNWPPRSLDLTQCCGFLWGPIKDLVCVPPMPTDIYELPPHFRCSCICCSRHAWTSVTRWTAELTFAMWQTGHISSLFKLPHELPQFLLSSKVYIVICNSHSKCTALTVFTYFVKTLCNVIQDMFLIPNFNL